MKISNRTRKLIVPLALVATMLNACATEEEPAEEITEKPAETASPSASASKVNVTARDYAFEGLPSTIKAGSTLALKNASAKEAHEVVAFKLPATEKRTAAQLFKLSEAELDKVIGAGPPATVIIGPPSSDGMAVLGDGSLKEAGRYVFACFIPTGADPAAYLKAAQESGDEAPVVAGGPPHFVQGMFAEATVE